MKNFVNILKNIDKAKVNLKDFLKKEKESLSKINKESDQFNKDQQSIDVNKEFTI